MLTVIVAAGCSKSPVETLTTTAPATTPKPATTTNIPPFSSITIPSTTSATTSTSSATLPPASTSVTVIPISSSTTTATGKPGVYEVNLYPGMVYVPDSLVVPVGSTVKFILVGGPDPSHPLGFFPPLAYSVSISGIDTVYTYTFTKVGLYKYYCTEHNTSGLVSVQ